MPTQCITPSVEYQGLSRRRVVGNFQGGLITSDGGALLLREVEHRRGILRRVAACFTDQRDAGRIEHPVKDLLAQRILGLALGYEDLNDHDTLRRDPLWGTLIGKSDPGGAARKRARDQGCALAGKSTLNRLEHTPKKQDDRYHKIAWDEEAMANLLVDLYMEVHAEAPEEIVLDLDATDDLIHGTQEGRFFHGYYGGYCYLPLYIFAGRQLVCAKLRPSNIDGAAGALEEVERIVERLRDRWPDVAITLRADSGFARDAIMTWCEAHSVDYVFGLARNKRLVAMIKTELDAVEVAATQSGQSTRQFKAFRYQTLKSWSCTRRVVGKAEYLPGGERPRANPRFVVTTLEDIEAARLYEEIYCARGEMENRIKEQQMDLFADRTSSATMRANQLRLWFSSLAYILLEELRRLGLAATRLARARAMTIRLKLFKIGAQVRVSVRRVAIMMSSSYPDAELFTQVMANLQRPPPG